MANIKKISVCDLRIGMVIAKLDRDWLDTPFLMQGFKIQDREEARVVTQYCEHVWIDTDLSPASDYSSSEGTASSAPSFGFEPECSVEEEHKRIQSEFKGSRTRTRDLHDNIRLGKEIDNASVRQTVDECVNSVLRNPDALLWMSKIRKESEYTAEHSLNVCILAVAFGRYLGYEKKDLEMLGLCGLLHDIGKMRVPLDILESSGKLSTKEMNMMKAHTVHGRNLLLSTPSVDPLVIDTAYSHHERIDGAGYPRKMQGKKISRFARIISIVDSYDAITADRCYSKARPSTTALKIIYEERGKQFDEELAIQFIKAIGLFPVGSVVELYTGEIGIVIEASLARRHLPRVVIVLDENKKKKDKYKFVNLAFIEEGDLPKDFLIKKVLPDGEHGVFLREYQGQGVLFVY